jgi:hypothetical protein
MGDSDLHSRLVKEKFLLAKYALEHSLYSGVGDEAVKTVEEAIELHASKFNRHLGSHTERRNWARSHYSREVQVALDELFRIYGDLGYNGRNGVKAKRAYELMMKILNSVGRELNVNLIA